METISSLYLFIVRSQNWYERSFVWLIEESFLTFMRKTIIKSIKYGLFSEEKNLKRANRGYCLVVNSTSVKSWKKKIYCVGERKRCRPVNFFSNILKKKVIIKHINLSIIEFFCKKIVEGFFVWSTLIWNTRWYRFRT